MSKRSLSDSEDEFVPEETEEALSNQIDFLASRALKKESILASSSLTSPQDFSGLQLVPEHEERPFWVLPSGRIFLESWAHNYDDAYEFLVAISEPVSRPEWIHEYMLTTWSLYAAIAVNIDTSTIIRTMSRLSKNHIPPQVIAYINESTSRYGKVKMVLKHNKFYVESSSSKILNDLLKNSLIADARVREEAVEGAAADLVTNGRVDEETGFVINEEAKEMRDNLNFGGGDSSSDDDFMSSDSDSVDDDDDDDDDDKGNRNMYGDVDSSDDDKEKKNKRPLNKKPPKQTVSFQISGSKSETVKRLAIEMDLPLMDEYDFKNDTHNPNLPIDLKPTTKIRRYQERSLSKMFGNGRARSGIIVLPCGAGKTLTGVTAAQTIGKRCIVLCTSAVSVLQWKFQFKEWTTIPEENIVCFTSEEKKDIPDKPIVLITTYAMITHGKRSERGEQIMSKIRSVEWGLMLMDEVHVVPAVTFRRVVGNVHAHTRLGLTATLVREDEKISDLNFLIGPKLYEANWLDLTKSGYLANVQCVEVRCPMTGPFMQQYLKTGLDINMKQLLYVMNPNKVMTAEFLIDYHEKEGDNIIIFSDLVYSLKEYSERMNIPAIYGKTPEKERRSILQNFRSETGLCKTICLSKVGDTSIDLPEANVIIQISSHYSSRRQEAQRLGRILRPKKTTSQDGKNRQSFNAYFYSLVSTDTQEMFYSSKRQKYLIDQGYTYKVVTNLSERAAEKSREKAAAFKKILKECNDDSDKAKQVAESNNIKPYVEINERAELQNIRFHKFDEEQEQEAKAVAANDASGSVGIGGKKKGSSNKKGRNNFFSKK